MVDDEKDRSDLEVAGFGLRAKLYRFDPTIVLCSITIMVCAGFIWYSEELNATRFIEQHKVTQQLLSQVIQNQTAIIKMIGEERAAMEDAAKSTNYILTLTQEERARLHLMMPKKLREQASTFQNFQSR